MLGAFVGDWGRSSLVFILLANAAGATGPAAAALEPAAPPGTPVFTTPLPDGFSLSGIVEAPDGSILGWQDRGNSRAAWASQLNTDGSFSSAFNPNTGPDQATSSVVAQSDGKLLVGGDFRTFSGAARTGLVRLHPDGTPEASFNADLNGSVSRIARQPDGKILILGGFTRVSGVARQGFARLDESGTLDPSLTSFGGYYGNPPKILRVLPSGSILIGGAFSELGGFVRSGIALLDPQGSVDPAFVPDPFSRSQEVPSGTIVQFPLLDEVLPLPDGQLLVGGEYRWVRDLPRTNLARLQASGRVDPTFNAGPIEGPAFHSIDYLGREPSGKLVLVGGFTQIGGHVRSRVARLAPDGQLDTGYTCGLSNYFTVTHGLLASNATLLVGGFANPPGASSFHFLARLSGGEAVAAQPLISEQPRAASVRVGQSVVFSATATSADPMSYQWFANGLPLPGQTNSTLTLEDVQLEQAGAYFLRVQNARGSVNTDVATLLVQPAPTAPGSGDPSFNPGAGANGEILVLEVQPDGQILIGGSFAQFDGVERRGLARLHSDGRLDAGFIAGTTGSGTVRALLLQPNGAVLVGGTFTQFNGQPAPNLVRLLPDGSVDSSFQVGAGPRSAVYALARQEDGQILVGGSFTSFGGQPLARLVRLQSNGELDPSFVPAPNGQVNSIAVLADGRILIGGCFGQVGNSTQIGIARLLPDGSVDPEFNPGWGLGGSFVGTCVSWVRPLADGRILAGGYVPRANDEVRNGIVRLLPSGQVDPSFYALPGSPALGSWVYAAAVQADDRIVIGGNLLILNDQFRDQIARLNQDGSLDPTFAVPVERSAGTTRVNALALLPDGAVIVAGEFTRSGGLPRNGIARFTAGAAAPGPPTAGGIVGLSLPTSRTPVGIASGVLRPATLGQDLVLAAPVSSFEPAEYQWESGGTNLLGATNPVLRIPNIPLAPPGPIRLLVRNSQGVAASRPVSFQVTGPAPKAGHADLAFAPAGPINGKVFSLVPEANGAVVIAGSLVSVGDRPVRMVARLGPDGRLEPAFAPAWVHSTGWATALAKDSSGRLLLGGNFTATRQDGSGTDATLTRLDQTGAIDTTFSPRFNSGGWVWSIAVRADGKVAAGGEFELVHGAGHRNLVLLNADDTVDDSWSPSFDGIVYELAWQPDGRLLAAGAFLNVDGVPAARLVRLTADGAVDATFQSSDPLDDVVTALAVQPDGKVLVGGSFLLAGSSFVGGLARFNPDGTLDSPFAPSIEGNVIHDILVQPDGKLLVTGAFSEVSSAPRPGVARLHPDGSLDAAFESGLELTFSTSANNPPVGFCLARQPDGHILVGGFFNAAAGRHRARVARLYGEAPAAAAPELIRPRIDQVTVRAGGTYLMAGWFQGIWPPQYQWFGPASPLVPLPGYTNRLFNLFDVTATNAGPYRLTANLGPTGPFAPEPITNVKVTPASSRAGLPDPSSFIRPGANGIVHALLRQPSGDLWIGGDFTQVDGQPRAGLARLLPDGRLDETVDVPSLRGAIRALALDSGQRLLVGGELRLADGTRANLARLDLAGTVDPTFRLTLDAGGTIACLATLGDGGIVLGGSFTALGGVARSHLARLNQDGSLHLQFEGGGPNGPVSALAVTPSGLWIGGDFSAVQGQNRPGFAGFNSSGELHPVSFLPVIAAQVRSALVRPDGGLILGGRFSNSDGETHRSLLALNPSGQYEPHWASLSVEGGASVVTALALQPDGRLVVGGPFTAARVGGESTARNGLARLSADGELDPEFDPEAGPAGFGAEPGVHSLLVEPDGSVLAAGGFSWINGQLRGGVARLVGTNPPSTSLARLPSPVLPRTFTVSEFSELVISNRFYAPDTPLGSLQITLGPGAPDGIAFNSETGLITWTPTETHGPGTYQLQLRARDRLVEGYEAIQTVPIQVFELNAPPALALVPPQQLRPGQTLALSLAAHDPDLPANKLRFWLGRDAPPGMSLDSASGLLSWTPTADQLGTFAVEVVVSDDAPAPAHAVARFAISVLAAAAPAALELISFTGTTMTLRWTGASDTAYELETSTDLVHWQAQDTLLGTGNPTSVSFELTVMDTPHRFYRLRQR